MKIVILEDEPHTAVQLAKDLQRLNKNITLLETLDSVESGINYFQKNGYPELVFSDIQIADGLSFEIFQQLPPTCPIIFCTAYDQYALPAFKSFGIDYILKPFSDKDLIQALEKYHKLKPVHLPIEVLVNLSKQFAPPKKQHLLIHFKEKIIPVSIGDIPFFYSSHHATSIFFEDTECIIRHSLEDLQTELNEEQFYRGSRNFIINRSFISHTEHYFGRKLRVSLRVPTPENIIISKAKAADFLAWLER